MRFSRYKQILVVFLCVTVASIYLWRINFYFRLQPLLHPTADSISIPLFSEAILLLLALFVFLVVQYFVGKRLAVRNIEKIANAYLCKTIPVWQRIVIAVIIPLLIASPAIYVLILEMRLIGFWYKDLAWFLIPALYLILLLNYCLNLIWFARIK